MSAPSVCRMVHYRSYGTPGGEYLPECRAAMITAVAEDGETVSLVVFNPTGIFFNTYVTKGEEPGCWHWPERV